MPKFHTTLRIDETGIEVPIVIEYALIPGSEGPDVPAYCEVNHVAGPLGMFFSYEMLSQLADDRKLQSTLMADSDTQGGW